MVNRGDLLGNATGAARREAEILAYRLQGLPPNATLVFTGFGRRLLPHSVESRDKEAWTRLPAAIAARTEGRSVDRTASASAEIPGVGVGSPRKRPGADLVRDEPGYTLGMSPKRILREDRTAEGTNSAEL